MPPLSKRSPRTAYVVQLLLWAYGTRMNFIHSLSFIGWGFFSQCWDWRIKVVDFENSLTIFLYSFAIIHPFWLKVPTCVLIRASEIRKKIGKKFIFLSGGRVLSQSCSLTLPFYAWSSSL